jgi:diacylglycerol kinase (ATP)
MKAIVLHNPEAGKGEVTREELEHAFRAQGIETIYQSTKEPDFETALEANAEVIVAAGGDGTLRKVFKRWWLIADRPVLTLALGTANNISRALEADDPWRKRIKRLAELKPSPFPFAEVRFDDQTDYFFESVGLGLLADGIGLGESDPDKIDELAGNTHGFGRDCRVLERLTSELPALPVELSSDTGIGHRSVLWLEVMNIPSAGPRLAIASAEVVMKRKVLQLAMVVPGKRELLLKWLQSHDPGDSPFEFFDLPEGSIRIRTDGPGFHIDDEYVPNPSGDSFQIEISRSAARLRVYR